MQSVCRDIDFIEEKEYSYRELFFLLRNKKGEREFYSYCRCLYDRFGFFDDAVKHSLPEYNDSSIYKETSKRVKELGEKNILWSGGVDSTYIVCAYIRECVPFVVHCDKNSVDDNPLFYDWLVKSGYRVILHNDINEVYDTKNLVSGYLADLLFSFNTTYSYHLQSGISFYDSMYYMSNRDELYSKIIDYGRLLQKATNSDYEIVRLLSFGMDYIQMANEINYTIFPKHRIITFFNTKEFSDISWTQYWYRTIKDNKPEFHNFICEVTQDDRMYSIQRNPNKIQKRLRRQSVNWIEPIYYYE